MGRPGKQIAPGADSALDDDDAPLSPQIRGSEKGTLVGAWIGVVLFGGITAFFFWHAGFPLFLKPGVPNPFLGIFGLIVLFMLVQAIRETIRLKRFGDPVLELTSVPVSVGGTVEGRVSLGSGLVSAPEFNAKLQCIHHYEEGSGKSSHIREKVLWSGDSQSTLLPGGIVPISIDLPAGQPESNGSNPWDMIVWRLTLTAPFRGIAFVEKYEIPVKGGHAAPHGTAAPGQPLASFGAPQQPATAKQAAGNLVFFLLFSLGALGVGLYFLYDAAPDIGKASASANWPVVAGRIVGSSLGETRNASFPDITYAYSVNGTDYQSSTVYPTGSGATAPARGSSMRSPTIHKSRSTIRPPIPTTPCSSPACASASSRACSSPPSSSPSRS